MQMLSYSAIASVTIRILTAALGLLAVKLTHSTLTPAGFETFSLVLFALAVGASAAAPINRHFWAANSIPVFIDSVLWTWLTIVVVLFCFSFVAATSGGIAFVPAVAVVAIGATYAFARTLERFVYGQVLFDVGFRQALLIPLLFAFVELIAVIVQWSFKSNSIYSRLLTPAVLFVFLFCLFKPSRFYLLKLISHGRQSLSNHLMIRNQLFSSQGVTTILYGVFTTIVIMSDRFVLGITNKGDEQFHADYLLVLSYAIAVQSLLNASLDLARKHVFQNKTWVSGAILFSRKTMLFYFGSAILLFLVFPVLQWTGAIPKSISFLLWSALITRSIAVMVIAFSCLDYVQSGKIAKAFPPLIAMIFITAVFLWLLVEKNDDALAAIFLINLAIAVSGVTYIRFNRRLIEGGQ